MILRSWSPRTTQVLATALIGVLLGFAFASTWDRLTAEAPDVEAAAAAARQEADGGPDAASTTE